MHRTKAALQLLQRKTLVPRTIKHITRSFGSSKKYDQADIKRHYASTTGTSNQQATAAAAKAESFLNGGNSLYVEEMYESWLEDPKSVHKVLLAMYLL